MGRSPALRWRWRRRSSAGAPADAKPASPAAAHVTASPAVPPFGTADDDAASCVSADDGGAYEDACETILHADAHPDGGLGLTDRALLDSQRAAVLELVKDVGRSLLTGQLSLMSVSMPVRMFEPRSYLQKLADPWTHIHYLVAAAAEPDPVRRLQLVATWFVAGLQHVFAAWRKPFNPILGETWAATLTDGRSTCSMFAEQAAHHPPVSVFELVGPPTRPGGPPAFTFRGASQPDVAFKAAGDVRTSAKGSRTLEFADGMRVDVTFPVYVLRGVVGTGTPRGEVVGTATFTAAAAGLQAELVFGRSRDPADAAAPLLQRGDAVTGTVHRLPPPPPPPPSRAPSDAGGLSAPRASTRGSTGGGFGSLLAAVRGDDAPPPRPPADVLATLRGNWLSHADWDGVRAWTLAADVPARWVAPPRARVLPSDAPRRADLVALAEADAGDATGLARAQSTKEALERAQRADAKARKEGRAAAGLAW